MAEGKVNVNGNGGSATLNMGNFRKMVANAITQRAMFLRDSIQSRKDVDAECDYPPLGQPVDPHKYQELYDRESIPNRVVQVLPKESWQIQPTVYEDEDPGVTTPFEQDWLSLNQVLRGQSYYQDEQGSPVWEYLLRADILSGIGQYGIILLGLEGDADLSRPADMTERYGKKLIYMRAFPETMALISEYETNAGSPRFGQPTAYNITFNDTRDVNSVAAPVMRVLNVHWTRIVHVADNLGSSEVFGVPRMQPVYNRLLDLRKLYGGSAEMYWLGALPGWIFKTQPSLGGDVEIDSTAMKDEFENYSTGLQRFLTVVGLDPVSMAPQVVDPTPQIAVHLESICIQLGIPIRVFKGSERGELASSQDDAAWNDRLRERQSNYITPRIIVPFVDRLIALGVLPAPKGYSISWPGLDSLTEKDRSVIASQRTICLAQYMTGHVYNLMGPLEFLSSILGMTEAQGKSILEKMNSNPEFRKRLIEMQRESEATKAPNGSQDRPKDAPWGGNSPNM